MSWRVNTGTVADGDHVADEHLAQARRERGSEIADLVGVREDHLRRGSGFWMSCWRAMV